MSLLERYPAGSPLRCAICDRELFRTTVELKTGDVVHASTVEAVEHPKPPAAGDVALCPEHGPTGVYLDPGDGRRIHVTTSP